MTLNTTVSKVRRMAMALVIGSMAFSMAPASADAQIRKDISANVNINPDLGRPSTLAPSVKITSAQFAGQDQTIAANPQFQVNWSVTNSPNTQILGFTLTMSVPRESGGVASSATHQLPASARSKLVTVFFAKPTPIDPAGPVTVTLKTHFRKNGINRTITTTSTVAF